MSQKPNTEPMDTTNKVLEQKGKTIFVEYSSAEPGQHFITVLQMMPALHRKQLIARISKEEKDGKCAFIAEGTNGDVLMMSAELDRVKKHLIERGHEIAMREVDTANHPALENSKDEPIPQNKPVSKTAQMKTIRAQKGGKKKIITR